MARWHDAVTGLSAIHHIGSTSVPGLAAKPIIDLLPVFANEHEADAARQAIEALGYEWLGEFGLMGRRYCRFDDPRTGERRVQAHAYAAGHPDIARHIAFRNWLRADPEGRASYEAVKRDCAARHGSDRDRYGDCKSSWIDAAEARALADGW